MVRHRCSSAVKIQASQKKAKQLRVRESIFEEGGNSSCLLPPRLPSEVFRTFKGCLLMACEVPGCIGLGHTTWTSKVLMCDVCASCLPVPPRFMLLVPTTSSIPAVSPPERIPGAPSSSGFPHPVGGSRLAKNPRFEDNSENLAIVSSCQETLTHSYDHEVEKGTSIRPRSDSCLSVSVGFPSRVAYSAKEPI